MTSLSMHKMKNLELATQNLNSSVARLTDAVETNNKYITRLNERVNNKAEKTEVAGTEETLKDERRFLRRRIIPSLAVTAVISAYIAVNGHEIYRDRCDSSVSNVPGWCDGVFVFDRDNRPNQTQQYLEDLSKTLNATCMQRNMIPGATQVPCDDRFPILDLRDHHG